MPNISLWRKYTKYDLKKKKNVCSYSDGIHPRTIIRQKVPECSNKALYLAMGIYPAAIKQCWTKAINIENKHKQFPQRKKAALKGEEKIFYNRSTREKVHHIFLYRDLNGGTIKAITFICCGSWSGRRSQGAVMRL